MPELFHRKIERTAIGFVIAIIAAASVGGIVEIAPLFTIDETVEEAPDLRLYTPLELAGRNIYLREGCYGCHSQMIRTLRDEVDATAPTRWPWSPSTTTRCCGARSAPGPISPASAASTPTSGMSNTSPTRARWCRNQHAGLPLARPHCAGDRRPDAAFAGAACARGALHGRDDRQRCR